jgi:hypothetical protein
MAFGGSPFGLDEIGLTKYEFCPILTYLHKGK